MKINKKNYNLDDVRLFKNEGKDKSEESYLIPYECIDPSICKLERVFIVKCEKENVFRGDHAHKQCFQYLVCLQGAIEVVCDDSKKVKKYILNSPEIGVLIPPTIWTKQIYIEKNSILMVLCDKKYDEDDYIRDFNEFKKYKDN